MANICCVCGERIGRNEKYYQLNKAYPEEHLCPSCAAGMQRVYQYAKAGDTDFRPEMRSFLEILRAGKADDTAMEYLDHFLDGCSRMYRAQLAASSEAAIKAVPQTPPAEKAEPQPLKKEAAHVPQVEPEIGKEEEATEQRQSKPDTEPKKEPALAAEQQIEKTPIAAAPRVKRVQPASAETAATAVVSPAALQAEATMATGNPISLTDGVEDAAATRRISLKRGERPAPSFDDAQETDEQDAFEDEEEKAPRGGLFGLGKKAQKKPFQYDDDDADDDEKKAPRGRLFAGKKKPASNAFADAGEEDENDEDDADRRPLTKSAGAAGAGLVRTMAWAVAAAGLIGGGAIGYAGGIVLYLLIGILCGGILGVAIAACMLAFAGAVENVHCIAKLLEEKDKG